MPLYEKHTHTPKTRKVTIKVRPATEEFIRSKPRGWLTSLVEQLEQEAFNKLPLAVRQKATQKPLEEHEKSFCQPWETFDPTVHKRRELDSLEEL